MLKIASVCVLCLLSLNLFGAQSDKTPGNELKIEVEEFSFLYEDETLTIKTKADLEGCDSLRVITLVIYSNATNIGDGGDEIVDVHKITPGEYEEWSFPLPKYQKGGTDTGHIINFALRQQMKFIFRGVVGDKSIMHEIEKKLW